MKILYLIDTLKGYGAEKSIVEIALRFKDVIPVFVHIYKGDDLKSSLLKEGIKVYSLNMSGKYGFKEAVSKLIPIIKNENPIIIHSALFRADMVARKLKKKFPNIIFIGSFVSNSYSTLRYSQLTPVEKLKLFSTQLLDRFTSGNVDYFISNSETIKKNNANLLGIPQEKITTIYRGRKVKLNNESLYPNPLLDLLPNLSNLTCFVNIARLQKSKGQFDLLRAFKIYHEKYPQSILLIGGEGRLKDDLQKEIKIQELGSAVFLLGYAKDVRTLFAITDYFVFPSYFEGLPGVVIEAILSRIPCIVSNIPEVMECFPSRGALFFPPGNAGEIFNKMEEATKIKDWEERTERSFEFAKRNFDIEVIREKYEIYYKSIILRHSRD